MKRFQVAGVMLFVVCALGAVSVSSASAAHQWLTLSGVGITKVESATIIGSVAIHDRSIPVLLGSREFTILCMGQFSGTLGPSGTDSITLFEDLSGGDQDKLNCEMSSAPNEICGGAGALVTLTPIGLPWKTLLTLSGTSVQDEITTTENAENFGFVTCGGFKDECVTKSESLKFVKNISVGSEFNFQETEVIGCTIGRASLNGKYVVLGFLVN
ncbi:MAG TPA: hypothetical protein VK730_04675 [Solirubrobacteraceae bacterium]|nr:hypothetical protein [Solirubrobacteraceae bacterium]